mmetsp:Transcript_446/g.1514  ORF Transcript_446/g.1514 Transcript_446/m.1514 type:complete len:246 (-) Transcript_446:1817-2554(-)
MTPDPARCALAWSSRSMEMSVYGVELAPEETWEETREEQEGAAEAAPPGAWCAAVTPRKWWPSFSSSSLRSWRSRAISSACRLLSAVTSASCATIESISSACWIAATLMAARVASSTSAFSSSASRRIRSSAAVTAASCWCRPCSCACWSSSLICSCCSSAASLYVWCTCVSWRAFRSSTAVTAARICFCTAAGCDATSCASSLIRFSTCDACIRSISLARSSALRIAASTSSCFCSAGLMRAIV